MKRKGLMLLFFAVLVGFVSFYFDSQIIWLVSLMRSGFFDEVFFGLTFASSEIIIFFFLTSLFLWREYKRRWILPLWISMGLSIAMSFILKIAVQRQRPYQQGIVSIVDFLRENSHNIWNFSFPSFQTMMVFCTVPILSKEFPKFKYVWVVFASLVGLSRVYFGLHFMSDVIAGALIGYLIGMIVVGYEKEKGFGEKVAEKIFGR